MNQKAAKKSCWTLMKSMLLVMNKFFNIENIDVACLKKGKVLRLVSERDTDVRDI